MVELDFERIRREGKARAKWVKGQAALNATRCTCGHIKIHHGTSEKPCGHVTCKCSGYVTRA